MKSNQKKNTKITLPRRCYRRAQSWMIALGVTSPLQGGIEIRSSTENVVDNLLKEMSLMCEENINENDERDIFRLLEGIKKFNSRA